MYLQVHLDEYVKVSEGMYKGIYEYDVKKKKRDSTSALIGKKPIVLLW